jgi:hypothetical protein
LAATTWQQEPHRHRHWRAVVYASAALTHAFILALSLIGALTHHQSLFVRQDEYAALQWLNEHTPPDALIVAAPQTGLYIPAWTGRRVFYGHRFETANGEARLAQVRAFYGSGDFGLLQEHPGYVFYGPREKALSGQTWQPDPAWKPLFQQGEVTVYVTQVGQE